MAEAATAKPFEHPPSRIPVLSRRQSLNVEPLVLQLNTGADGRPGSASGVHKRPSVSRRQSLLPNGPSRKSSFGDKSRDPGDQAELREAYRRSTEIYSSIPSPTIGEASTPRLANLPEDAVSPPRGTPCLASLTSPTSSQSNEGRGIPHSDPSYDLQRSAVTPARDANSTAANGKYGLSRIPQSTVMHAVSLHPTASPNKYDATPSPTLRSPFLGVESPNRIGLGLPSSPDGRISPLRRATAGSAASTKVIDGLQTEVQHLRVVLEKTRQDLRSSQRVVGSLTRQSEDLKDTKDRLRGEIDTLNNALKRRERLLQGTISSGPADLETVDRARTAEAELYEIKSSRKILEQSTKKQLQHMTAQVTEATFAQTKSDKECASLKDSVRSLRDAWGREMKGVRDEWKKAQEKEKQERDEARMKHMALARLVQSQGADRQAIQTLATDVLKQSEAASAAYEDQLALMRAEVEKNAQETRSAQETAQ